MNNVCAEDITLCYDKNYILENLTIDFQQNKITTIIGPNGCGKSSLLKALGRIVKIQKGAVYLYGKQINTMPTKEIARKMAILPQTPQSPQGLTVGELVEYGRFPYQSKFSTRTQKDNEIIAWALQVTQLADLEDVSLDNLSGGQRQRAWIAMALAQDTDVILLDEPTTYLDLSHQLELLQLLYHLNRKEARTIIMVLHDLNLAARFSDYMIAMNNRTIVKSGPPHDIMTHEVIKEVFNIDANIAIDSESKTPVLSTYNLIDDAKTMSKEAV